MGASSHVQSRHTESRWWPEWLTLDLGTGFTDDELERLCEPSPTDADVGRFRIFGSSWATEIYGFGEAWRRVCHWPSFLPLPVSADHGVNFWSDYQEHELSNTFRYHLTWSKFRAQRGMPGKEIVEVQHPWVMYRKALQIEPNPNRRGTVAFIDHSIPTDGPDSTDWRPYFAELRALSDDFELRAIVIHPNDIAKGLHYELRSFGYPIFTLGRSWSPLFPGRFYDLLGRFKYSTSAVLGSHTLLSEEFGVFSFLLGEKRALEDADHGTIENNYESCVEVFSKLPPGPSNLRAQYLSDYLRTDLSPKLVVANLRRLFMGEMLHRLAQVIPKRIQKHRRKFTRSVKRLLS